MLKDEQMLAYAGSPSSFATATRNICPIFQLTLNSEQPASVSCIHFGKAEMAQQSCRHHTSPTMFYTCASCIFTSMSLPASLALMPKYEGFRSSLGCWVYLQALLQKSWKQPQYLKNNHVCTIKGALNYPVHHTCHRIRLKFVGMYPLQEVYPGVHLPQDMSTFVDIYHTPHRTFLGTHAIGYVQRLYVGMMPDITCTG